MTPREKILSKLEPCGNGKCMIRHHGGMTAGICKCIGEIGSQRMKHNFITMLDALKQADEIKDGPSYADTEYFGDLEHFYKENDMISGRYAKWAISKLKQYMDGDRMTERINI